MTNIFKTTPNTFSKESAVLSFVNKVPLFNAKLMLFYVPDRDLVLDNDYHFFLNHVLKMSWESPDLFLSELAESFYQSVLPFHMEMHLIYNNEAHQFDKHICVVRHQPKYKIPPRLEHQLYKHF